MFTFERLEVWQKAIEFADLVKRIFRIKLRRVPPASTGLQPGVPGKVRLLSRFSGFSLRQIKPLKRLFHGRSEAPGLSPVPIKVGFLPACISNTRPLIHG